MAKARRETPRSAAAPRRSADPRRRRFFLALFALFLLMAATAEERTYGTVSDEQQMLYTAVSMAEQGEIGVARGQLFTVHRKGGDAVSPYGLGLSLVDVVPALAASPFERTFGAGSSQSLFVLTQILLIVSAAGAAGLLAGTLGAGEAGALVAVFATGLGSPLWAYTASNYSEPLQALALVLALLLAARAPRAGARAPALAALAGLAAGFSVLGKSLNVLLAPLVLLPLLLDGEGPPLAPRRLKLLAAEALGSAIPLGTWLAFELVRFGRPFASYGGTGFNRPVPDGLWRLLVGPNKGLVLYFPFVLFSVAGLAALFRRREARGSALAIAGSSAVLLLLSSAWWAWDGTVGWGPRLLIPLVPLLSAAAAIVVPERGALRSVAFVLAGTGVLVNALGVFQTEASAQAYLVSLPPVRVGEAVAAKAPTEFVQRATDGSPLLPVSFVCASDAVFSPLRLHAFLLGTRLSGSDRAEVERLQASPPWKGSRPAAIPDPRLRAAARSAPYLVSPFAWPHLFASLKRPRDERAEAFHPAWDSALADQVLRNLDVGRPERALVLAERLFEITPSGYSAALYAESLRAAGRKETLEQLLATLPPAWRGSPSLAVVEALRARDAGDEELAKRILSRVTPFASRPGVVRALASPLSAWPANLHAMTGENLADRELSLPGVGSRR